MFNATVLN